MDERSMIQKVNELLNTGYKIDWIDISRHKNLPESFIREFKNEVDWYWISKYQKLSENFIREFQDKIDWPYISKHQDLSESFIRDFQDKVNWFLISRYQNLSEDFIREFKYKVDWPHISTCQKLSEPFIREFKGYASWYCISKYQKLSNKFINEFKYKLYLNEIKESWHYKTTDEKKQAVIATGLYECHEDYFIAYKGIRSDRYSKFNFQYKYEKGGIYESWCDCTNNENSFGLSVWDELNARDYCDELVVKVKVNYEDVGRVVHNGGKIRCFKIKILE